MPLAIDAYNFTTFFNWSCLHGLDSWLGLSHKIRTCLSISISVLRMSYHNCCCICFCRVPSTEGSYTIDGAWSAVPSLGCPGLACIVYTQNAWYVKWGGKGEKKRQETWRWPITADKRQALPLVAPQRQDRKFQTEWISGRKSHSGLDTKTDWLTDWLTDWPTISRNVTSASACR
jgi:hypothetical protein